DRARAAHRVHNEVGEEAGDAVDVGDDARLELTRMAGDEEGHGHALDVGVDLATEPGHHARAGGGDEVALTVSGRPLDEGNTQDGHGDQLEHRDVPIAE